jgi:hypothetical protein
MDSLRLKKNLGLTAFSSIRESDSLKEIWPETFSFCYEDALKG